MSIPPFSDRIIRDETGTQRLLGYVIDIGHDDRCARVHLEAGDQHMNRHGVLHGGIAATLLDNASGMTASMRVDPAKLTPVQTMSLTVDYLAPGGPGPLIAVGLLRGGGRKVQFVDAELRDADGRLIAKSSGVFKATVSREG